MMFEDGILSSRTLRVAMRNQNLFASVSIKVAAVCSSVKTSKLCQSYWNKSFYYPS